MLGNIKYLTQILKISIIIVCSVIFLVVGVIMTLDWLMGLPCPPPPKPQDVPISAVYIGGCDGGDWIELVSIKSDTGV